MNTKTELPKTYNPKEVEDKIYEKWEKSGLFNPDNLEAASDRFWKAEPFSIAMPPPNITAELHLGHATYTIQDIMTRHARMSGKKALWLPGTDHAAIATNFVVERELWEKQKKTRHDIGREVFLARIEEFITKTRGKIQIQLRKMGFSADWSREKYTFSPELSFAVRTAFKKMHDAGLIYRGDRIVNWCPRCGTTLADDEVEYHEEAGKLYYILYPFPRQKGGVTIATVRPETMLGDTAVAVHPENVKYKKYIGKTVMQPLVNRELPIIADPEIEAEYGTGAMKVTPAHDHHDFELAQKHNLEIMGVFDMNGKISQTEAYDHGFEQYAGLSILDAREKIVRDLTALGFMEKVEDAQHRIAVCYRCATPVEPVISKQWFVNVNSEFRIKNQEFREKLKLAEKTSLKQIATAAIKSGAIKIIPERFTKIYLHWMENLRDWNISRQIWFGHQIPVWYCGGESEHQDITKMGFREDVVKRVLGGTTKTYRLRDHQLEIGSRVAFENSQTGTLFGYATITNVEKTKVGDLELADPAHGEPYGSQEKLIADLKKHNPELKVGKDTQAFVYSFTFTPIQGSGESCGEMIVSVVDPAKCPNCGNTNLKQDPDTLDTWFSSSLWTFSTLGWPSSAKASEGMPSDLETFHPTTIMETAYDILFFWVARMILMTGFAMEDVPFRTVYLHGLVRDQKGQKMSKSLKNVIDPLDMIAKYGTDALRLSMIIGTTPGVDTKISEQKIKNYRNFANKLWNISRFILKQGNPKSQIPNPKLSPETLADQWILSELDNLIMQINKYFETYQYGLAGEALEDFTWRKFADWYLEISKIKNQKSKSEKILPYVLTQLLKLWHPFIPFVTEHIWSHMSEAFLMIQEYPVPAKGGNFQFPISNFQKLQELIAGLRNLRAEYRQPPGEIFASYMELPKDLSWLSEQIPIVEKLARVRLNLEPMPPGKQMPYFLWEGTKIFLIIPHFDPKKERAIAEQELAEDRQRLERLARQTKKKDFLKKAPQEIVEKIKTEQARSQARVELLKTKIKSLR